MAWNFGKPDTSSVSNPTPKTYADTGICTIMLIASALHSCIDTSYQTVVIEAEFYFISRIHLHPMGKGVTITSQASVFFLKFGMTIFDRWGNMIFVSDDINKPWDGRANKGKEIALADVYIYLVKVTDFKMLKHSYTGIVSLVR